MPCMYVCYRPHRMAHYDDGQILLHRCTSILTFPHTQVPNYSLYSSRTYHDSDNLTNRLTNSDLQDVIPPSLAPITAANYPITLDTAVTAAQTLSCTAAPPKSPSQAPIRPARPIRHPVKGRKGAAHSTAHTASTVVVRSKRGLRVQTGGLKSDEQVQLMGGGTWANDTPLPAPSATSQFSKLGPEGIMAAHMLLEASTALKPLPAVVSNALLEPSEHHRADAQMLLAEGTSSRGYMDIIQEHSHRLTPEMVGPLPNTTSFS